MEIKNSGGLKKRGIPNFWLQLWTFISEFWIYKIILGSALGLLLCLEDYLSNDCNKIYYANNILGSIVGTFMIWSGSSFIAYYIECRYDWEKETLKKSILLIFCNIIYIIFCVLFIILGIILFTGDEIPLKVYAKSLIFSFLITIIVNLVFISIGIHDYWAKAKEEIGVLKQENLRSQLETLKNQVNPHFLFNSLNTLISIIDEEPEIAKNFTQKLSQVYRYILKAQENDLVELKEELLFSEAYEYMLIIRYSNNLKFIKNIAEKYLTLKLPPLVLQMLVENAIKHNVISAEKPLEVLIFIDETEHLVVQNNFQPKIINVESSKVGLKNIADRFKLLFHKEIIVENTKTYFSVKLPLSMMN